MKFDEVHFENAKGHAVTLLKNAEKALEEGNIEYVGWSLSDAHSYLTTMRNEAYNDGATDAVRAKYEEIAARYNAAKEALEKQEAAVEQEEEDKTNEDASIVKLIVAIRNVLNIISAIKENGIEYDDIEKINSAILLLDELAQVDVDEIGEILEDAKKDATIVQKVEAVKGAFESLNRDEIVEDTIERLRMYKDRKGDEVIELTNAAIFAAIHQEVDAIKTIHEVVRKGTEPGDNVWRADRFGVGKDKYGDGVNLIYEVVRNDSCWNRDLNLYLKGSNDKLYPLATIRFKGYDEDAIRKISAIGCEYALAFDQINEII